MNRFPFLINIDEGTDLHCTLIQAMTDLQMRIANGEHALKHTLTDLQELADRLVETLERQGY